MDKAERVVALLRVGPLRNRITTDDRLDEIAAILRREYGDVRREALEKAARVCDEARKRCVDELRYTEHPYDMTTLEIQAKQAAADAAAIRTTSGADVICEWKQEDGWDCCDRWDTECGHAYSVLSGWPQKDGMDYCCYCGRRIKAIPAKEET